MGDTDYLSTETITLPIGLTLFAISQFSLYRSISMCHNFRRSLRAVFLMNNGGFHLCKREFDIKP